MNNTPFFVPQYVDIIGGKPLNKDATVTISGAKNELLGNMAAAVLTDQPVILYNVPYIQDTIDMGWALIEAGVDLKYNPEQKMMRIHAKNISSDVLSDKTMKFRASYYLWGALLARFAITKESDSITAMLPGGCNFGDRGYDYHFKLLKTILGADVRTGQDKFKIILPKKQSADDKLYLTDKPSHGATFHYLLTSATALPRTHMYNAALEPEVASLIDMLHKMGAKDTRGKNATEIMSGKNGDLLKGCEHTIMPDRMETGTYALLAMGTNSKIKLNQIDLESCTPWLNLAKEMTGVVPQTPWASSSSAAFDFTKTNWSKISGRDIAASAYPGKETDMEQIWASILPLANSTSTIIDYIWPMRFGTPEQAAELNKFGINMSYVSDFGGVALRAEIHPSKLQPATVTAANLRGAMGYIVAAAIADGKSRVYRPGFATRGYPNLIKNLQNIGVDITASGDGTMLDPLPYWDLSRERGN